MSPQRPLIGVTPCYDHEKRQTYIKHGYIEGVYAAGGLAVLLPLVADEKVLADLLDRCDGFLLSGGADIDAKYYGECNMPYNGEISPYRDHMEIFTARRAMEGNKPILGICRGIQVINVAMGGTLYQDVYSQIKGKELLKHSQEAPKWYPTHDIHIERDSRLWSCFMTESMNVNSFHHQAVKDVASGFVITARADDGIIESIESPEHIFAVGVQWHPELMWEEIPVFLKLFEQLVKASYIACVKGSKIT